ncbi:MAG: IreB family regulatory phosphoprotein [Clostridia bacterium]|nr:IreB family regulatory phosphoprotein [Clostridia bacterium]
MSMMQEEKLSEIITLLEEKGYDPVAQLTGYIELDNEEYITRHGGAREKIKTIDKSYIKEYLKTQK